MPPCWPKRSGSSGEIKQVRSIVFDPFAPAKARFKSILLRSTLKFTATFIIVLLPLDVGVIGFCEFLDIIDNTALAVLRHLFVLYPAVKTG